MKSFVLVLVLVLGFFGKVQAEHEDDDEDDFQGMASRLASGILPRFSLALSASQYHHRTALE
jgi:hypothetical protein